jgi:hypothetical protein
MLPNFLVIGAVKGGSTSTYGYLRTHPQVFMPSIKELNFFYGRNWERGIDWYESWFAGAADSVAVGEASPGYTRHPIVRGVPGRIASVIPSARLVYVIRHPVERLLSQYRHAAIESLTKRTLEDVATDPTSGYVSASRYAMQIDRYLEHFPREQLLVITSEDLRDERVPTLRRVFEFIGVDPEWVPPNVSQELNPASGLRTPGKTALRIRRVEAYQGLRRRVPKPVRRRLWRMASRPGALAPEALELSDAARETLLGHLRPDLVHLRDHLGADFHCWGLLDEQPH